MTMTSRSCVLGTRVSSGTKMRFVALAAHHQLSASGFLAKLVEDVLKANPLTALDSDAPHGRSNAPADDPANDRLTLRLRPGDRALAAARADSRGMKTCSYLTLLVHNHVRRAAVLPPNELDHLKVICARLAALGRELRMFGMPNTAAQPPAGEPCGDVFAQLRREIEVACDATARVVRQNLVSWEAAGGEDGWDGRHA